MSRFLGRLGVPDQCYDLIDVVLRTFKPSFFASWVVVRRSFFWANAGIIKSAALVMTQSSNQRWYNIHICTCACACNMYAYTAHTAHHEQRMHACFHTSSPLSLPPWPSLVPHALPSSRSSYPCPQLLPSTSETSVRYSAHIPIVPLAPTPQVFSKSPSIEASHPSNEASIPPPKTSLVFHW